MTENNKVNESMLDLFRIEVETQTNACKENLALLESNKDTALESLIQCAQAIKGAAQLVNVQLALEITKKLEAVLTEALNANARIGKTQTSTISDTNEYLITISAYDIKDLENPDKEKQTKHNNMLSSLDSMFDDIYFEDEEAQTPDTPEETSQETEDKEEAITSFGVPQRIDPTMLDLFKTELENNLDVISNSLLLIEENPDNEHELERLMRASHSIKGAARLLEIESVVKLAHIMEDCFVAAQNGKIRVDETQTDVFLSSVDILKEIALLSAIEHQDWTADNTDRIIDHIAQLNVIKSGKTSQPKSTSHQIELKTEPAKKDSPTEVTESFNVPDDIDPMMLDLFKTELENNLDVLSNGILTLEDDPEDEQQLEKLMRASHSIKGAARLIGIEAVVKLAHVMEDCFVAAQNQKITIDEQHTDVFLKCVDILKEISQLKVSEHREWTDNNSGNIVDFINQLDAIKNGKQAKPVTKKADKPEEETPKDDAPKPKPSSPAKQEAAKEPVTTADTVVRVSAKRINSLMSLAGELSVTSNWVRNYSASMLGLKKKHNELIDNIDRLRIVLEEKELTDLESDLISGIQLKAASYRETLTSQIIELDDFDRRSSNLTGRINHEIIASRMRPFKDSTQGYKRMVRDISRSLKKKIKLEIVGEDTQVDREILEKIEAPINHMIRNAIDHGIEMPKERIQHHKPEQGTIRLEASHNAGRLSIIVADDGRGVDIEKIRKKVLDKKLVNKSMADNLSKSELLDFLFLPAFSTRDQVTEISGRGVGLDVVHSSLQEMRGKLHSTTELGQGMQIHMELPLTLSVIRSLLVKTADELYAFPLAAIHNLVKIHKSEISILEDKQYITIDDKHIGLIHTAQILGKISSNPDDDLLSVVIIGDWNNLYGLVVDEMIGERGLALRPLDSRLGKVKDINSSALTDDGEPILVFDVDDLIQSVQDIISGKDIAKIGASGSTGTATKRILVVDDSLTVREIEKKLLESRGYYVDVAIDGVDGWNTVRTGHYDLVISDVDMPRMNGIELVTLIKNDAALRNMPVMMVSYKDRPEDKQKGLEAGADYYLTKGSFHDETLVESVRDLIGAPN